MEESRLKSARAYLVYNNRLQPTVEVKINNKFRGAAPAGASTGSKEVKYKNPVRVINLLNKNIFPSYEGEDLRNFEKIDREIKHLKSQIGGNGSIAFSFALFNAYFYFEDVQHATFPLPLGNVIGGGAHHGFTDIQEFLAIPKRAKSFPEAFKILIRIYEEANQTFSKKFCGYNDEGALIIKEKQNKILDKLSEIASRYQAYLGVDFAANSYYDAKTNTYLFEGKKLKPEEYIERVIELIKTYKLWYAEDPVQEKDVEGFKILTKKTKSFITGDDLTVTNPSNVLKFAKDEVIRGVIIKPNQIGTVSEALDSKRIADKYNLLAVISHRSGEADDYTISRLAVMYGFKVIKAGIAQSRIPKLNELMRLWQTIQHPKMSRI
ncbi:MAG: hypothetical protein GXN99_00910 [Candidatus Nanohaloarchaeota archaeon]|nr:hypothetical protein [Candidatus Nanohaloarchaeota archaeon]